MSEGCMSVWLAALTPTALRNAPESSKLLKKYLAMYVQVTPSETRARATNPTAARFHRLAAPKLGRMATASAPIRTK
jgi:hypothetical protein